MLPLAVLTLADDVCQAAGLIVIAHDSGGPREDIVVPFDGCDASSSVDALLTKARATQRSDW